jgi:drug/metabolite transporter (DMT)-like permease
VSDVALLPLERVERERRPAVGYAMALAAGTLFAINGTVSKVILESGIPALRLTEVRCVGGFLGLLAIVLMTRPENAPDRPARAAAGRGIRRLRGRPRPALLLPGDPQAPDRGLAADPVPRTADRRR